VCPHFVCVSLASCSVFDYLQNFRQILLHLPSEVDTVSCVLHTDVGYITHQVRSKVTPSGHTKTDSYSGPTAPSWPRKWSVASLNCLVIQRVDRLSITHASLQYHRLRGSASPVLTATGLVIERWQFSPPPLQNRHPLTDRQKIVTGDYVGDPYSCAKFGAHPTTGASVRTGELI